MITRTNWRKEERIQNEAKKIDKFFRDEKYRLRKSREKRLFIFILLLLKLSNVSEVYVH